MIQRPAPLSLPLVLSWSAIVGYLALIYAPDAGHGFVKDDFAWILDSRLRSGSDAIRLLTEAHGFYRPLVALTFGVNRHVFNLNALGYGMTNLGCLMACAAAIALLTQALGMPRACGPLAAALWSLNFHGIDMGVLWISGRTALILTLCSVLALRACVKRRALALGVWTLLALLSKEEAVFLPFIATAWILLSDRSSGLEESWPQRVGVAFRSALWSWLALVAYIALRVPSGALDPSTAPPFYRFTFDPLTLLWNAAQYVDRSCTFSVTVVALLAINNRQGPRMARELKLWTLLGVIWWIGGFALTMFLPVRSSLYACFPSVGIALAASPIALSLWHQADRRARLRAVIVGSCLVILLFPVYKTRNHRMVREAELSTSVLVKIAALGDLSHTDAILIRDEGGRPSAVSAFGTLAQDAVALTTGRRLTVWIDPPPPDWRLAGLEPVTPGSSTRVLTVRNGVVAIER